MKASKHKVHIKGLEELADYLATEAVSHGEVLGFIEDSLSKKDIKNIITKTLKMLDRITRD